MEKKWKKPMLIKVCEFYTTERRVIIALVKEALEREAEIEGLVVGVFRRDKTPAYGYGGKRDQDRFGFLPYGVGKRWSSPMELAQGYARRHGFELKLWDRVDKL